MTLVTATQPVLSWKVRMAWRHPEWWTLGLSLLAWITLFWEHDHRHPHLDALASDLLGWLVMVIAMMFPLAIGPVRTVASRSLWRRRHRAIAGFLVGYVSMWFIAGVVAIAVLAAMRSGHGQESRTPGAAAGLGLAIAAAWQVTLLKRRALRACHRTMPLAPRGWRADRDCVRYGLLNGRDCLISCWALMLPPVLASHHLALMAGITVVAGAERYGRPDQSRVTAAVLAGLALACAVFAAGAWSG